MIDAVNSFRQHDSSDEDEVVHHKDLGSSLTQIKTLVDELTSQLHGRSQQLAAEETRHAADIAELLDQIEQMDAKIAQMEQSHKRQIEDIETRNAKRVKRCEDEMHGYVQAADFIRSKLQTAFAVDKPALSPRMGESGEDSEADTVHVIDSEGEEEDGQEREEAQKQASGEAAVRRLSASMFINKKVE